MHTQSRPTITKCCSRSLLMRPDMVGANDRPRTRLFWAQYRMLLGETVKSQNGYLVQLRGFSGITALCVLDERIQVLKILVVSFTLLSSLSYMTGRAWSLTVTYPDLKERDAQRYEKTRGCEGSIFAVDLASKRGLTNDCRLLLDVTCLPVVLNTLYRSLCHVLKEILTRHICSCGLHVSVTHLARAIAKNY